MPVVHVHIDGAARGNPGPAGLGIVFSTPEGEVLDTLYRYLGETTNNVAEYQALLAALEGARRLGLKRLRIHTDSQLLQRQLAGQYRVKTPHLLPLFQEAQQRLTGLKEYEILHIPREENAEADRLANRAIDEHFQH
jgi:ribonuclease HI